MVELLSHFKAGELIGLVAVGGGLLVAIVAIVAGHCHKIREMALKEEMVNRGMSADEIRMCLTRARNQVVGTRKNVSPAGAKSAARTFALAKHRL